MGWDRLVGVEFCFDFSIAYFHFLDEYKGKTPEFLCLLCLMFMQVKITFGLSSINFPQNDNLCIDDSCIHAMVGI